MPVVSNTSPILNLAIVGQLTLLKFQFDLVLIPFEVRAELKIDTEFAGAAAVRQALAEGLIQTMEIEAADLYRVLALELDQGESAAITLALEQKISAILIDESDGRAKARAMGLQPLGVLGILLRAKRAGHVKSVKEIMRALREEAGFFIDDGLSEAVLKEAGE